MAGYTKRWLSAAALDRVAERFAHPEPTRLRLLYALMDGEKTVSEPVGETSGSIHGRLVAELGGRSQGQPVREGTSRDSVPNAIFYRYMAMR